MTPRCRSSFRPETCRWQPLRRKLRLSFASRRHSGLVAKYDDIGKTYQATRTPDPRIRELLDRRIGTSERVLNIGAGTGSYEPVDRFVVAIDPSQTMLDQRPVGAAPAIRASAESLPFASASFDLAMAILSMHHWTDWRRGVSEALRVSGGRFVVLTWIGFPNGFWLTDYFPEIEPLDLPLFPQLAEFESEFGPVAVDTVPIPHDCTDGFLCAFWRRPAAYLESSVRNGISTFSKIADPAARLQSLRRDLSSGAWSEKYGDILRCETFDYGYRIVSFG